MQQTIKAHVRDIVASLLSLSSASKFSRNSVSSISILTFHRVLPPQLRDRYPLPGIAITPDDLYWVLGVLKKYFDVQTVSNAVTAVSHHNRNKPLLAITFDDGQWDNLKYGLPVLSKLELPATFYIPTAYIGGEKLLWHDEAGFSWLQLKQRRKEILRDISPGPISEGCITSAQIFLAYLKGLTIQQRNEFVSKLKQIEPGFPAWARLMDWAEVTQLHQNGHEIGSHSRNHTLLSQLSPKVQRKEIVQSMQDIETAIGVTPDSFCYPDGNFNEQTLSILGESGYKTAVTTQWGANKDLSTPFELRRFDMNSNCLHDRKGRLSETRLQLRMSPFQPGM